MFSFIASVRISFKSVISGVVCSVGIVLVIRSAPSVPMFAHGDPNLFKTKKIKFAVVVFPFVPVTPIILIDFDG